MFFETKDRSRLDQVNFLDRPLFDRALKSLGPLKNDEMYSFEPAFAAGGNANVKNLGKVDTNSHLVLLAQLGKRRIMRDIVKDAKAAGLL